MPQDAVRNPTFAHWIRQNGADDGAKVPDQPPGGFTTVRKVARWIAQDTCWPTRSRTLGNLLAHLRSFHADDEGAPPELAVRIAFERFRSFLAQGGTVRKRQPKDAVHRGFLVRNATIGFVRDLARIRSERLGRPVSMGDVIDEEMARAHRRECRARS